MTTIDFLPSATQGKLADISMRAELGDSLAYLLGQLRDSLILDKSWWKEAVRGLHQGEAYPPAVFALYAELVWSLAKEDDKRAQNCVTAIERIQPLSPGLPPLAWDHPALAPHRELLHEIMKAGNGEDFALAVPADLRQARFLEALPKVQQLLQETLPDLHGEFEALVSQIIMVGDGSGGRLQFDGGSSYMLWGGLFINVERERTTVELLEMLVHEAAHLLLYAAAREEPLLVNPDTQRYPSPLREDPRPMDGIYHATWVSARMCLAMHALAQSSRLDAAKRAEADAAFHASRDNFLEGHQVVRAHGLLTPIGDRLMGQAHDWMVSVSV